MTLTESTTDIENFKNWVTAMGFSTQSETAKALGVHRNTIVNYETGKVPIPFATRLAMSALFHGLKP